MSCGPTSPGSGGAHEGDVVEASRPALERRDLQDQIGVTSAIGDQRFEAQHAPDVALQDAQNVTQR